MKVSVVIPAHNEEKNVAATIRAILAQDYPDFEVIVIDNASTDRTAAIASGFPVKVVHESRKGLLWARERGRLEATGDIIANIDADCLPESDWLRRGVSNFKDLRVVAVTGPYDYHDGTMFFRHSSLLTQKYLYKIVSELFQMPFIRHGALLIGGNNFIRADVLTKAGGYDTSILFYGEDTDTAKRVSVHGKVHFNPKMAMRTSARRFKNEGTLNILTKYWYHFFKATFSRSNTKGNRSKTDKSGPHKKNDRRR